MHRTLTDSDNLTPKERKRTLKQTESLIQGLCHLRDALKECAGKECFQLSCSDIEDHLGRATEYLSSLEKSEKYIVLKRSIFDFAQPLMRAADRGDKKSIRKRNLMLATLELEVAKTHLPLRLILAIGFCINESVVATLEALRIIQSGLHTQERYFNHDEFSPRTLSEWLTGLTPSTRQHLWRYRQSATETLFLFTYRNNVGRASEACKKWRSYREQHRLQENSNGSCGSFFSGLMSI